MSNRSKDELMGEITAGVRAMQVAADLFDDASAELLGVNRTDHRALDILDQEGPMTAGNLADRNHLSPAAMTTVIDRLEHKGYARRFPDPDDRRRVLVEMTPLARRRAMKIYAPLAEQAMKMKSRYSAADLEAVARFLTDATEINATELERVKAMRAAGTPPRT
jgi:DNA-binding MarR family transcriptional regulator